MAASSASTETKSERLGVAVTPTELKALEFIEKTHGKKYDGTSSVLRDYSLTEAVEFYLRAKDTLSV